MQLMKAIFVKPHGIFLKLVLKEQDLSHEDIEGLFKTINEDLHILLPQMTYVNKRISSRKSKRLWNSKWFECQVTLTHLIDCMIQILPVIQAALNDCTDYLKWLADQTSFTLSDFDRFSGKFAFQCEDSKFREVTELERGSQACINP